MKKLGEWQKTLKEAADRRFPNNLSGTFDRITSIQEQLDDLKAALEVEQGIRESDDHAHQDPNHRVVALIADVLIFAEEHSADIEPHVKVADTQFSVDDRITLIQKQLDELKKVIDARKELDSDMHAVQKPDQHIGALVAVVLILAEERGADVHGELEKVLGWFNQGVA